MIKQQPFASKPAGQPASWSSPFFAMATAAAAWLIYLSTAALRCLVYGFTHPAMLIERHALTAIVAVGMAGLLFLFLRRYETASMRVRLAAALLVAVLPAAVLSVINYNVMFVFAPQAYLADIGMTMHAGVFGEVLDSAAENYCIFSGWAALYTAVSHAVQTQDVLRRAAASDAAARSAELRALRFQLDPHFLFNALNTVSGLMLGGNVQAADRTIEALSAFLRATFTIDASEDVCLSDELALQELYLQVEQVRFGDRLRVETVVPDELRHARMPALLLQPVIENSIRHAVARSTTPVRIVVAARAREGDLVIAISNDGPDGAAAGGHGVGLANVASRLALRYDGLAGCDHGRPPGGGFETRITLPLQLERNPLAIAA